jgi:hemin uptake protein HemP
VAFRAYQNALPRNATEGVPYRTAELQKGRRLFHRKRSIVRRRRRRYEVIASKSSHDGASLALGTTIATEAPCVRYFFTRVESLSMEALPPSTAAAANETEPSPATDVVRIDERLIYRSPELLRGRREIWIEHGRDMYKLRITSQGRLILTK